MIDCNVLIVGGGLAGLSAAVHLRRAGVEDVMVIERMSGEQYGHYHRTCGEAVSDRMLRLSGIEADCAVRRIDEAVITCAGVDISVRVKGQIIDRERLLEAMRAQSGARIVTGSVRSVRRDADGYTVMTGSEEYRCRYLIGADGAFSIVRKSIFGHVPEVRIATVNNIVRGDSDSGTIRFSVSPEYNGLYTWDFPSKDGLRSVGYTIGDDDVEGYVERGIRYIVTSNDRTVVKEDCCIVGDAAILANPLCYGGIGVALLSGRKAAEAIAKNDLGRYQRWARRAPMLDHHYMEAYRTVRAWAPEDYPDAVVPFRRGSSFILLRGAYGMVRRPKWANVYTSIWMGFKFCW